jgi:hypothetical protein
MTANTDSGHETAFPDAAASNYYENNELTV